jgi:hypothetical protein
LSWPSFEEAFVGRILAAFPLLALPVAAYNLVLLLTSGLRSPTAVAELSGRAFVVRMSSGALWEISVGDLLLASALVVLFVELLKSTSTRGVAIVNHSLSMLLFVVCLVEFLLLPGFATSAFCLIGLMVLLDVLAGFIVTIIAARRDVDVSRPERG